ncbi:MAG: polysaccharide deacetylase family protein [Desulfuromonadales bacterium]|nr:polysaccharide deacetylase family protein [Desulfuromonadales bacterium]
MVTSSQSKKILLTVDVEDWFQVENFKGCISFREWNSHALRVDKNLHTLLDLMDSCGFRHEKNGSEGQATFFVLGWVAAKRPDLVREIHCRGYEIASHGFYHNLCFNEDRECLRNDLVSSRKLLEDIIGGAVTGYRAPSFSINGEVLNLVQECGYLYDSSYNSFSLNSRYGDLDLSDLPKRGIAYRVSENFYEIPVSNIHLGRYVLPWGGGGYFRLLPTRLYTQGVRHLLKKNDAVVFYLHPWELDPEQPRVSDISLSHRFRHYVNLNRTAVKLQTFIQSFKDCRFGSCADYLSVAA